MDDLRLRGELERIMRGAMSLATEHSPDQHTLKAHQDYVTNVDLATDSYLEAELGALIPGCPVLSEERAVAHDGHLAQYWIVDPIDGTLNLMAGIPFYGIAVALVDAQGPRMAAVAAIAQDELCIAVRGKGAWKDGEPLRLPAEPGAPLIVLSTGLLDRLVAEHGQTYAQLRAIGKIRNLGSQALHLCGVAQGRFAAVASLEARAWDEAAAGLILREAGGVWASRVDGMDWTAPAALMAITEQRSLAAHPSRYTALAEILAPVFTDD